MGWLLAICIVYMFTLDRASRDEHRRLKPVQKVFSYTSAISGGIIFY